MALHPSLKEYGQLESNEPSKRTVLKAENGWTLTHHTAGYEPAGSAARYTQERWSVALYDTRTNTTYGRSFRTLDEADSWFRERISMSRSVVSNA